MTPTAAATPDHAQLALEGMTCAACAARIEKKLNRLDGVAATVNYATEQAAVDYDPELVALPDLVAAVEAAGYRARPLAAPGAPAEDAAAGAARAEEAAGATALLRARLLVAIALALPVAVLSMASATQFSGWRWVALALAAPAVLWAGWPFHRSALVTARHGDATMDTLVAVGTLAALGWSTVVLVAGLDQHVYFESGPVIIALILLGRTLEAGAKRRAGAAVRALLSLQPAEARVLRDGSEVTVPAAALSPGDLFVVRPGERIATDGVVNEGDSEIDRSLLTGESVPVPVAVGGEVAGGTVNANGRLVVRATRVGADTALARIARLVTEAQTGKAPVQRLADRISAVFVPVVLALAGATLAGWLLAGGSAGDAVTAAVAVLIVACPCALGLATPTALLAGTGRGAQLGVLVRGPEALERIRRITAVVLDKTGTVTEGRPVLTAVELEPGTTRAEALRLAGALEAASEHPVGRAITAAAQAEAEAAGSVLPPVDAFRALPGIGVAGRVDGRLLEVGRGSESAGAGGAPGGGIALTESGRVLARFTVADRVRPTSAEAIRAFRRLGLDPVLLTGDDEATARAVAAEVGIERVIAGVLPEGKADEVRRLQAAGERVAFVGDGVNDAPALALADLGIAIGTGTDVAIEAADVTLVSPDLRAAVDAILLARRTLATIHGNLFWAFAYNVAAIPVAAAGLLDPMIAAGAMACSSLFVVGNSLRLRRFHSSRESDPETAALKTRALLDAVQRCSRTR